MRPQGLTGSSTLRSPLLPHWANRWLVIDDGKYLAVTPSSRCWFNFDVLNQMSVGARVINRSETSPRLTESKTSATSPSVLKPSANGSHVACGPAWQFLEAAALREVPITVRDYLEESNKWLRPCRVGGYYTSLHKSRYNYDNLVRRLVLLDVLKQINFKFKWLAAVGQLRQLSWARAKASPFKSA